MDILSVENIALCLAAGLFSGLAAGFMGVGGGLVNVPALYFVFQAAGYPQELCFHLALGTSLAIIVFSSTSSARTHFRNGNLLLPVATIAGLCGIIGSFAAASTAVILSDTLLKKAFAVLLLAAAIRLFRGRKTPAPIEGEVRLEPWRLAAIGLAAGVLAGFFGIGGGLVGVPLFILWAKIPPHKAIGSSSGMVVILSAAGAIGYALSTPSQHLAYSIGFVNLPGAALIAVSSIYFAGLGANLAARSTPGKLTVIFVIGLVLVGFKMLFD